MLTSCYPLFFHFWFVKKNVCPDYCQAVKMWKWPGIGRIKLTEFNLKYFDFYRLNTDRLLSSAIDEASPITGNDSSMWFMNNICYIDRCTLLIVLHYSHKTWSHLWSWYKLSKTCVALRIGINIEILVPVTFFCFLSHVVWLMSTQLPHELHRRAIWRDSCLCETPLLLAPYY